MTPPKEISSKDIFGRTIRIYQNLCTSDPRTVFDDMDINQHALEERCAEEVAKENRQQEEQHLTGRPVRTG